MWQSKQSKLLKSFFDVCFLSARAVYVLQQDQHVRLKSLHIPITHRRLRVCLIQYTLKLKTFDY